MPLFTRQIRQRTERSSDRCPCSPCLDAKTFFLGVTRSSPGIFSHIYAKPENGTVYLRVKPRLVKRKGIAFLRGFYKFREIRNIEDFLHTVSKIRVLNYKKKKE